MRRCREPRRSCLLYHENDRRNHSHHSRQRHAITGSLPITPTITAFERSPDRGKGLARDARVRWALEEVGQPYELRLVSFGAMKEPAHLALHPFGQIPTYEEGDLGLFETRATTMPISSTAPVSCDRTGPNRRERSRLASRRGARRSAEKCKTTLRNLPKAGGAILFYTF